MWEVERSQLIPNNLIKPQPRQGYDRGRDEVLEDLGNNQGFLRAVSLVLRLKPGGLLFAGLPCNSFAFMSKGSHKRSPSNPLGSNYGFVVTGNMIAARSCILFLLALVRSTCWALENPARSTLPLFPYMQSMMGLPLFRHCSVFWWYPQLFLVKLVLCSCGIVGEAHTRQAIHDILELQHLSDWGGWAAMDTPPRSRSWDSAMCFPALDSPYMCYNWRHNIVIWSCLQVWVTRHPPIHVHMSL